MVVVQTYVAKGKQINHHTTATSNDVVMPPTSKKLTGHIGFGLCMCPSIRSRTVHARVLKFHIWIPHGKIVDTHFFFSLPSYLPI